MACGDLRKNFRVSIRLRAVHDIGQRVAIREIDTRVAHPLRRQRGNVERRRGLQPARKRLGHDAS